MLISVLMLTSDLASPSGSAAMWCKMKRFALLTRGHSQQETRAASLFTSLQKIQWDIADCRLRRDDHAVVLYSIQRRNTRLARSTLFCLVTCWCKEITMTELKSDNCTSVALLLRFIQWLRTMQVRWS